MAGRFSRRLTPRFGYIFALRLHQAIRRLSSGDRFHVEQFCLYGKREGNRYGKAGSIEAASG
jgi:hypothetical protein